MYNMNKAKSTRWNIPVSELLDATLEMAVELDGLASKSELVRISVRKELAERGFRVGVGNRQQTTIVYDPPQKIQEAPQKP